MLGLKTFAWGQTFQRRPSRLWATFTTLDYIIISSNSKLYYQDFAQILLHTHTSCTRLLSFQTQDCTTRILLRSFSRLILGLCHPWYITHQARPEDSRTLRGNIVSIKLFIAWMLSNPNPQKISTSGRDVPTLPGKPTDLVLRPRREDGTQISSYEARFLDLGGGWCFS